MSGPPFACTHTAVGYGKSLDLMRRNATTVDSMINHKEER